jgi:hypothetical protein
MAATSWRDKIDNNPRETPTISGRKIYRGKNLYGARIGFLMLDVLTPRMLGKQNPAESCK